ncbi:MAG: arylsulfatase [Planctomycetes bacterium]|jgi:arylsulfatase A-like enzyme|nr:arylsulfatase [Planctomycetota bacterium]MBT4029378.1 arylsulfatase [Planctomycetota bacterium]MBT4559822.1 arylsulfatase [Planctomycetota bacterium]MBT5101683.1 arylsulfatase [Planctomycetota bacterium]MBT7011811.1 arylsulfatase [Planctomycetota bacterium]
MRYWLLPALITALSACSDRPTAATTASGEATQPDIILILADDLGVGDWGAGGGEMHTPNLDKLCADGVRLDRYYTYPLCTPTRVSLMSGSSPARYEMIFSPLRPWDARALPRDIVTLPDRLRQVGYRTALVGKWHLGHAKPWMHPNARGFDHFYGFVTGAIDYVTRNSRNGGLDWQRNGQSVTEEGYSTTLFGAEAASWIGKQKKTEPFFMYLPFNAPHTPLQAPKRFTEHYTDTVSDPDRRVYCAMVEAMDEAIGKVMTAVEARGRADNTLIIFVSDNGASPKHGGNNGPLRGGKGTTFEGSLRVPGVMHWPAELPAGTVSSQLVSSLDWYPTILDAAGTSAQNPDGINAQPDGKSILETLSPELETQPREDLFFATCTSKMTSYSVIRWPWKLTQRIFRGTEVTRNFLFNLSEDPKESNNLNEPEVAIGNELREAILTWVKEVHPDGVDYHMPASCTTQTPPTGWQAPADWTDLGTLQTVDKPQMAPAPDLREQH